MSSDRKEYVRGSPESPPPYSGDTQLWAEDLDNYLRRRMQKLEGRIRELEIRAGIAYAYNGADGTADIADQRNDEGEADT